MSTENNEGSEQRKIIHIDMDDFYASIEQRDHPEWRGKPVIVGGDPERRGVVATCSYEARVFGVHSAMPSRTAARLCTHAIFVPPRFAVYREVSAQIMSIFRTMTDLVEPLSLDEAYLDVTHNFRGEPSATRVAQEIKARIYAETGLTASAGVSFNKFIAKLASDYRKPDGLTVIPPARAEQFLARMPIGKFFGVGRVTAARLQEHGIETGADLRRLSEAELRALLHERGGSLYQQVRGRDDREVQPTRERKSIGKETTLVEDTRDERMLLGLLAQLASQVEQRLRELGLVARTLTLKLKWHDFTLMTRSITSATYCRDAETMTTALGPVLLASLQAEARSVRLIGVTVSHLLPQVDYSPVQALPTLWDDEF
jgi:DNA polymerase-4